MRHTRALSLGSIVPDRAGCRPPAPIRLTGCGWEERLTVGPVAR